MNTERFKTLDRILITNESLSKMEEWVANPKNNAINFETFDFPLNEGLVVQKAEKYSSEQIKDMLRKVGRSDEFNEIDIEKFNQHAAGKEIHTYFKIENGNIECCQYQYDSITNKYDLLAGYELDEEFCDTKKLNVKNKGVSLMSQDEFQKTGQYVYRMLLLIFHYINNYKEGLKVTEYKITRTKKGKAKKGKPSKNRTVKIGVKTYSFYTESEMKQLRNYNISMPSWRVRGHWRHYKDGKTVWIKPYVKGEGEIEGKEYKV